MLTQSKEVQNAWRASQRTLDIKVTIDGKTYGATDINSLKYDSGAYNGDTFAIGSTYSNTVQIEFSHLIEGLKLGMEVRPSIGIKTSSGYVYEPLGVFIISSEIKMDRNNNLTTVSASDRFCGLEGAYVSKLTYPAKVLDVIAEICAQSGVKANTDDLARLPHQADLPAPITGQSYRKALGWIAQLYVGYALFDRQGLFTIRTISEPNYELDPSQYEQAGLTKNEAAYKINGIQCQVTITTKTRDGESAEETKTYQAGDATGSQIKLENNIMTPQRLNDIWEQLKDLTFYPFSLNWFGNPAVEAGDWLRLEDKQGNSFVVPNSSYTLDFNGGLSATSKADQTTSSDQMVPWQGNVAQTIKELKIRRSPDGTVVFPPSVTEPPANAKFNDVWFKKNGNSTELWIFENQDDGSGKWIRKDLSDDEIKKKVADAQQGLNQAKADIINNKQKADTDIENLNKSIEANKKIADQDIQNLNKSIEDNKKVADESLQKLNDSVTNLQGQYDNNVVPNLNKVMADASDALQKYITAQNSIADLTKQAQQQGKDIADVTNTVKGLNVNYANLAGDVSSTKVDVKGLQTTVGTANGDIAQLKLDAQNLQTMLAGKVDNTTYTNFVNLTNQALNARLTASDLNGYAKTVDVQATANGLRFDLNSVTDRMNNLKIGGRNLVPGTSNNWTKVDNSWGPNWPLDPSKWSVGDALTISAEVRNGSGTIQVGFYDRVNGTDNTAWGGKSIPAGGHGYLSFTYKVREGTTIVRPTIWTNPQPGAFEYRNLMVEKSSTPSNWVPAPEDTEHSLTELSSRINATSQQFSSYYTKSETDNRTNSAKNDAINTIRNDGNWQGLSNILTNSGFLQTADGFLQKVQQTTVPMFNGGGINLATKTGNVSLSGGYNSSKNIGYISLDAINDLCGKYMTVSVDVEWSGWKSGNQNRVGYELQINYDDGSTEYDGCWLTPTTANGKQRVTATYKIKDQHVKSLGEGNAYIQINCTSAKVSRLKIEQGSVATPWIPNPADLATQSAFSELSQSLEGLRSTVGSNYGSLQSQISQSSSAVRTELIDKLNGVQNQITTTANGLRIDLNSVTDRMNNLKASTRNLLFNTEDFQNYGVNGNAKIENISTLTSVPNHPEIIKIAHGWGDYQSAYSDQYVTLEKDKIYWFGFYVCTDNTTQSPYSTMAVYANEKNSVANAKRWAYVNTQDYSYYGGKAQNWTWHVYKIIGDGKTYHHWRAEPSNHVRSSYYATGYTLVQSDIAPTEHVNSPEDTKNSLEQLSARITTNSQQFSSYYTKSEADNRTNSAKSDAVNAIKSDSNWQGLSNILTNSGFLQTADGFIQKVQQTTTPMFNGGGINLALNTSDRWSDSWWNGFNGGENQTKVITQIKFKNLNAGDWITGSVNYQYQGLSGNNMTINVQGFGNKTAWNGDTFGAPSSQKLSASSNTQWGKFQFSFQVTANMLDLSKNDYYNVQFRVDNAKGGWLQWCYVKFEAGTTATPWSPAPNDLATQSAFSELSQTVQGLRSTVSSNYGDLQTQLSQSSSGIRTDLTNKITGLQTQLTTTANGLNAKIGAIQVGGRNLLHGTSDSWKSFTVSGWGLFSSASSTNTSTDGYKKGDQFTYSAMIDNNGSHPVSLEAVAFDGNNNGSYNNSELIPAGSKNYRVKVTFAIQENTKYIRTSVMFPNASGANDTIRIKDEQLEEGNLCTQWTPNPDDISNQFTELNATINGLQSTVSSNHSDFQSQISQTAKTIRQEVSDKTNGLQTQINQQSNNFNVSLNSLRNETAWQKVTSAIDANNYKTTGNYWIQAAPNSNTPDSSAWAYLQVVAYPDVKRIKQTWQRDNNENEIYTRLLIGDNWTSWQRTVTGGNIMAQINMSAGATLIQNDKIYMDASSTIFSGNAFIPSAAITSLNADKITAGTINGAKVNVINLNANNITAGTLKGSNGEFYLDSGSLHVWQGDHNAWIDKNGIHDSDNSGNNVWISNGSISAYGNSSGAYLFDGGLYLHKSQSLSDAVLNPNYGSITKSDNIVSFGTSGLDIDGKDGFLLRTHGWNDQTLAYLNGNEIIGAGIAGKSDGFMNIAAKKQLFLYAGEPVQNDKLKTIPKLVLDGTYQNGQTALKGTFSQYFFQGPSSGFSGGITLQDEFVNVGSLNGKNYFSISNDGAISITANGKSILSLNGLFPGVNGDFNVSGNFTVTGSKNAVVPTSRGMAAINAYETAEYYFGDIGETQTNSNGVVTVMIDPYFLETVNTLVPYQVFLTPYGNGNVWVSSRSANNFTVKSSNPNIHFAWEIKAKRKGYENDRMKIVKGVFNNEQY